ncbi:MAG: hypothetical protein AAF697_14000 [Pseudomonadota bacterium]
MTRVPAQIGAAHVQTVPPTTMPQRGGAVLQHHATKGPIISEERTVGPDGVTTITRTRRIVRSSHQPATHHPISHHPVAHHPIGPAKVVLGRDQWIAECNRRIRGKSEDSKGSIIGGLLGAVAGGVLGNVIAAEGDKLAGSLIGGGTGGLAGLLLGKIIGGGKKNGRYDCEAALDGYLASYDEFGAAHRFGQLHSANFTHGYGYAGCGCQQIVMVPVKQTVRQRVIVREKVKEKVTHPEPPKHPKHPSPKMIKQ